MRMGPAASGIRSGPHLGAKARSSTDGRPHPLAVAGMNASPLLGRHLCCSASSPADGFVCSLSAEEGSVEMGSKDAEGGAMRMGRGARKFSRAKGNVTHERVRAEEGGAMRMGKEGGRGSHAWRERELG
jgi:hypothetical protein